jgi:energy-coupling factor transporter ATP-binding protein EcfA2
MFFKQIDITNFRSIESLTINNIKQVNILTGRNNCGKTTVLEALFLLMGISKPELVLSIHAFRGLLLKYDKALCSLFRNRDFTKNIIINGILDTEERSLKISPLYPTLKDMIKPITGKGEFSKEDLVSNVSSNVSVSTTPENTIEGLSYDFKINNTNNYHSELKIEQNKIIPPKNYNGDITGKFLTPAAIMNEIYNDIESISVRKKLGSIINTLKEIEPDITDITLGGGGMIYADIGIETLIPVNLLGDGSRRVLSILAAIAETKNGVLLIDEVENGLHYRSLSVLWKAILKAAIENNVQLFITTHSYECIQALAEIYQSQPFEINKDILSLYRIDRRNNQHKAFQYEVDSLEYAIEKKFEVR